MPQHFPQLGRTQSQGRSAQPLQTQGLGAIPRPSPMSRPQASLPGLLPQQASRNRFIGGSLPQMAQPNFGPQFGAPGLPRSPQFGGFTGRFGFQGGGQPLNQPQNPFLNPRQPFNRKRRFQDFYPPWFNQQNRQPQTNPFNRRFF